MGSVIMRSSSAAREALGSSGLAVLGLRGRRWLSLATLSGAALYVQCSGFRRSRFSCCGAQARGSEASEAVARGLQSAGSILVAPGLSRSVACGIFPDQGSNQRLLHCKAYS